MKDLNNKALENHMSEKDRADLDEDATLPIERWNAMECLTNRL
ncbi:hypothetical protein [Neobacillus drentensis]